MKKFITLFLCILSFSSFAANPTWCKKAPDVTASNFCSEFKAIAQCHCQADGNLPAGMCKDMATIYNRMIAAFGSQERACIWQENNGVPEITTAQMCMNDWNCYRLGGNHGGLCGGGSGGPGSRC